MTSRNRRITHIDPVRLRAANHSYHSTAARHCGADLEASTEPTERWHEMAGVLVDDDSTSDRRPAAVAVIGVGVLPWLVALIWCFRP